MVMKVNFPAGIPEGCLDWLIQNVGPGNIDPTLPRDRQIRPERIESDTWFYERVVRAAQIIHYYSRSNTIDVFDEKLATMFILRWS
jgi:hypothetical protein